MLSLILLTPLGVFLWFKRPGASNGKVKKIVKVIASTILLLLWIVSVIGAFTGFRTTETFEIDGKQVSISCPGSCSGIEAYGDESAVRSLAGIGVRSLDDAPPQKEGDTVAISVDKEHYAQPILSSLAYSDRKLISIFNTNYPSIIYFSATGDTVSYPSLDLAASIKTKQERAAKAEAKTKSEAAAKTKAEAEAKDKAEASARAKARAKTEAKNKRKKPSVKPLKPEFHHQVIRPFSAMKYSVKSTHITAARCTRFSES